MRSNKCSLIVAIILSIGLIPGSNAGEAEQAVVDKVVAAYGGEKFVNLKSITITSNEFSRWPGQGYYPEIDQPILYKQIITLDPSNKRGKSEIRAADENMVYHYGNVVNKDNSSQIDFTARYYWDNQSDYYSVLGGYMRGIDTILAYELYQRRDEARFEGNEIYLGESHSNISIDYPNSPPLRLMVNDKTGLIMKMTRDYGEEKDALNYFYNNHTKNDGVAFARKYTFMHNNNVDVSTYGRTIKVNQATEQDFKLDSFLVPVTEVPKHDTPMQTKMSDDLYQIHAEGGTSAFVDAGDYSIGVGGTAGFTERFNAYQRTAGEKPLKYFVVTHHHADHLVAVVEAFELGAILVVPDTVKKTVETMLAGKSLENRIISVSERTKIGPAEMLLFNSNHAEKNIAVFLESAKTIFQADHYEGNQADVPAPANKNSVYLKGALDQMNLNIDFILGSHSRKVHRWQDFVTAVSAYDDECPKGRAICQ